MSNDSVLLFDFSGYIKVAASEVKVIDLLTNEIKLASDFDPEVLKAKLNSNELLIDNFTYSHDNALDGTTELQNFEVEVL